MKNLLIIVIVTILAIACGNGPTQNERENLSRFKIGDSVFAKSPKDKKPYISVGTLKRVPILDQEELRRLKYHRKDTMGFESIMLQIREAEECFYVANNSFIGICTGIDSAQTEYNGKYFVQIKPSKCLKQLIGKSPFFEKEIEYYHVALNEVYYSNQFK